MFLNCTAKAKELERETQYFLRKVLGLKNAACIKRKKIRKMVKYKMNAFPQL